MLAGCKNVPCGYNYAHGACERCAHEEFQNKMRIIEAEKKAKAELASKNADGNKI